MWELGPTANRYRVSFGGEENTLEQIVVMVTQYINTLKATELQ